MTPILIATEGDTVDQDCAHVPCVGSGTYSIDPVTLQGFFYVSGSLVVPNGQTYEAHGTSTCVSSTTLLYVNGEAVCRDGDSLNHHHDTYGIDVINQSIVYSE
jgi:hypothetical protein